MIIKSIVSVVNGYWIPCVNRVPIKRKHNKPLRSNCIFIFTTFRYDLNRHNEVLRWILIAEIESQFEAMPSLWLDRLERRTGPRWSRHFQKWSSPDYVNCFSSTISLESKCQGWRSHSNPTVAKRYFQHTKKKLMTWYGDVQFDMWRWSNAKHSQCTDRMTAKKQSHNWPYNYTHTRCTYWRSSPLHGRCHRTTLQLFSDNKLQNEQTKGKIVRTHNLHISITHSIHIWCQLLRTNKRVNWILWIV